VDRWIYGVETDVAFWPDAWLNEEEETLRVQVELKHRKRELAGELYDKLTKVVMEKRWRQTLGVSY
jgi:hypothetical protein